MHAHLKVLPPALSAVVWLSVECVLAARLSERCDACPSLRLMSVHVAAMSFWLGFPYGNHLALLDLFLYPGSGRIFL